MDAATRWPSGADLREVSDVTEGGETTSSAMTSVGPRWGSPAAATRYRRFQPSRAARCWIVSVNVRAAAFWGRSCVPRSRQKRAST